MRLLSVFPIKVQEEENLRYKIVPLYLELE